jgi:transcriptional regulator with XRE-family HTH domain
MKALRLERRISLEELGKRVGLAKSTIAGYESGFREPSLGTVVAIANAFRVTTDYLLGLTDEPAYGGPTAGDDGVLHWNGEPLSDADMKELLALLRRAEASARERGGTA